MIVVDGSFGEGGGQILRTSIALSSLLLKPVKVINIRAKRKPPGLKRQHMTAIKVLATLTNAEVKGLELGSMAIEFIPKVRRGGHFSFDIGTAGSISLVLQAALPVMLYASTSVSLTIRGGTDVPWSPPIDYVRNVLVPLLNEMGAKVNIRVERRGHYPRGGGIVHILVEPVKKLRPLRKLSRGSVLAIYGISHAVKLPSHVAIRQAKAAASVLERHGYRNVKIKTEYYERGKDQHLGPGSGIVLWAKTENSILGADALGARGKPAEKVGEEAALKLIDNLSTNAALDTHMSDMIVPFLAVAEGVSEITGARLTMHAYTNIEVVKKFINTEVYLEGKLNSPFKFRIRGIGLTP